MELKKIPQKRTKKKIAVSIDEEVYEASNEIAKKSKVSFSYLVNYVLAYNLGFIKDKEEDKK